MNIYLYDAKGAITSIIHDGGPPDYVDFLKDTNTQFSICQDKHDPHEVYVHNGAVKLKPTMPIQPIMNAVKIGHPIAFKGLPKQTVLTIDGQAHILDNGEAELTPDHVGTYRLMFEKWPYQSVDVTIEVEP